MILQWMIIYPLEEEEERPKAPERAPTAPAAPATPVVLAAPGDVPLQADPAVLGRCPGHGTDVHDRRAVVVAALHPVAHRHLHHARQYPALIPSQQPCLPTAIRVLLESEVGYPRTRQLQRIFIFKAHPRRWRFQVSQTMAGVEFSGSIFCTNAGSFLCCCNDMF